MSNYQHKPEVFEVSDTNQLYLTSDLHFFHKRIVEFTGRPTTFENLNEWIITQCNNKIPKPQQGKKVTTIHLGDFAFSCTNEQLEEILLSLNGDWWFILGNHDNTGKLISVINKVNAETGTNHRLLGWYYRLLVTQTPVDKSKKKHKKSVILCHFPIEDWDSKHYGSAMIHGHVHGGGSNHDGYGIQKLPNRFDVGIDNSHTWSPFSYDDLRVILRKTRGVLPNDGPNT